MFKLDGKNSLVTGAGSGIGKAIAAAFVRQGARVWIGDVDETNGAKAAEEIGEGTEFVHLDVTSSDSISNCIDTIQSAAGRLDVQVNSAGISFIGTVLETEEADWDRVMAVNAKGLFLCCKAAVAQMKQQEPKGGLIINISSIASMVAVPERFLYSTTKAAVLQMTRSIALDHIQDDIRCNCICPGRVHTPFVDDYLEKYYPDNKEEMFEKLSNYQPIGRMAQPEEIAAMAVYLASDEASFVTGTPFTIDGGITMG